MPAVLKHGSTDQTDRHRSTASNAKWSPVLLKHDVETRSLQFSVATVRADGGSARTAEVEFSQSLPGSADVLRVQKDWSTWLDSWNVSQSMAKLVIGFKDSCRR